MKRCRLRAASHADVDGLQRRQRRAVAGAERSSDSSPVIAVIAANPSAVSCSATTDLGIELVIDRKHPIGRDDAAGIADVILESALTTIVDLEDSVAAVDAEDKTAAYSNWLGLMRGDLAATFDKGGRTMTRKLEDDRSVALAERMAEFTLPGRSLLFVRNVGHLMTTPAVQVAPMAPKRRKAFSMRW